MAPSPIPRPFCFPSGFYVLQACRIGRVSGYPREAGGWRQPPEDTGQRKEHWKIITDVHKGLQLSVDRSNTRRDVDRKVKEAEASPEEWCLFFPDMEYRFLSKMPKGLQSSLKEMGARFEEGSCEATLPFEIGPPGTYSLVSFGNKGFADGAWLRISK